LSSCNDSARSSQTKSLWEETICRAEEEELADRGMAQKILNLVRLRQMENEQLNSNQKRFPRGKQI
jgi:hypothetical protein